MTAQLLTFPIARPREERRAVGFQPRREYGLADIARLLALRGQRRTMIETLRALADQRGMPLPKNPRRWGKAICTGPAAIGSGSRWCALEVDAWLDRWRSPPPNAPAAGLPPLPRAARDDMAHRAALLGCRA